MAESEPKKAQIVYEAAPEVRNFLKEATKFMPTAVANKMKLAKGEGRLLEPEEFDKLQDEGYMEPKKQATKQDDEEVEAFLKNQGTSTTYEVEQAAEAAVQEAAYEMMAAEAAGDIHNIGSEAAVAEKKLRQVEIEEVEDEDM
jgi:hypothetical protein